MTEQVYRFEIGARVKASQEIEPENADGDEIFTSPQDVGIVEEREPYRTYPNLGPAYLVAFQKPDGTPITDEWMYEDDLHPA